ncbi:Protein export cytoplasm protein SecA ATPase RNA helicase [Clostridiaceae bacterium JG1575]|nr:Protein export cytoplasm protein SecA ATPase RNA helicase [Clostridiaceae bacterium JG1575]
MGLLDKLFGTYSEREVNRILPTVQKINALEAKYQAMSDEELQAMTPHFKERLAQGETLDDLLVDAYALVREASVRVLGMRHFDVQMIGGIVLHQGRIAEMKTGEGKTLVATLPCYLNGLTGQGVHVVTVNDYLAKLQGEWMGELYQFLGLSTGIILHGLTAEERREAYASDITYGTNNEFGFDYLRDNMVVYQEEMVQRPLQFAIVDEVDSILIDEARTPLIISGEGDKSTEMYQVADVFVKRLHETDDFTKDEKAHSVILTEEGIAKVEKYFNLENFGDTSHMELQHHINQALKANYLFKADKDYMVKDGEIIIVDEFTGRLMEGRRYSDGLHQAIEAKEHVDVLKESKTLATITFQNYFRMYHKLSGMTGTALTEENEFRSTYNLDVIVIPTNLPVVRKDHPDVVYKTVEGKYRGLLEEIVETYQRGQPVLVGTTSVEKSELVSELLKRAHVPHQVLNARYHEKEAEIVSHAGEKGMVTIATNMAGRGTDIKLGEGVRELGGLKILGTERHEARRIDNQLRGRSGRQGDPGESRFYISLDDDLMRIFGGDLLKDRVSRLGLKDDEAIESRMVSGAIENAQKKVEGNNFDSRKTLLGYDDVMNQQREIIYRQRREVMQGEDLKESIQGMMVRAIDAAVDRFTQGDQNTDEDYQNLARYMQILVAQDASLSIESLKEQSAQEVKDYYKKAAFDRYEAQEQKYPDQIRELERVVLLRVVDNKWMDHIDNMDRLKRGIGLRAYRQQDPVQAYQFEGTDMFNEMIETIDEETTRFLLNVEIRTHEEVEREQVAKETGTNQDDSLPNQPVVRKEQKVGRNDPCPCGSGKKYKNCHGRGKN